MPERYSPAAVGVVQGIVQLSNGTAVDGATVQLFDANGDPYDHTDSNPTGRFTLSDVPVGSYFITATKPGYAIPARIALSVTQGKPTTVTITMQTDPTASLGAIFGIVRNSTSSQLLTNATVQLFLESNGAETLIGSVRTNTAGQYLFYNLADGDYLIRASTPGYLSNQSAVVSISGKQFAPLDIVLSADPEANTGTVSGIIIDATTGSALSNATVALYQITGTTENVVSITHTNAGGLYLFGDVSAGTYRVKATVQTEI
ncbi:hypothetical protein YSY43_04530 [Paenibacillus sp. YSY-4.3]